MKNFEMSRSSVARLELTSRNGCGRLCDYCPQSTYIREYKSLTRLDEVRNNSLTFELVKKVTPNIPLQTIISHTGFTEPFDNPDFPEITDYFGSMGFAQAISTTLYGLKTNQEYFIENLQKFNHSITLHLPDAGGLMKGDFNERYSDFFSALIERYYYLREKQLISDAFCIFLIGDDFHPSIRSSALTFERQNGGDRVHRAKYLNSRAGAIIPAKFHKKSTQKVRIDGATYYCAYQRLNRGVMLPNGDVTICSQDYGLKRVLGSLLIDSLDSIYSRIEADQAMKTQFLAGEFSPCTECEHYRPVTESPSGNRLN